MASDSAKASLRIFSEQLSCSDITKFIGIQPTKFHEKGSPVSKNSTSIRDESLWVYSPELSGDLEDQIQSLANTLIETDSVNIIKDEVTMEFFCSVSSDNGQGSVFLDSSIISKLSSLGIELSIDYYLVE